MVLNHSDAAFLGISKMVHTLAEDKIKLADACMNYMTTRNADFNFLSYLSVSYFYCQLIEKIHVFVYSVKMNSVIMFRKKKVCIIKYNERFELFTILNIDMKFKIII